MLAGFALAAVTYMYIFAGLTHFANPKLENALANAPVTLTTDPAECSFQFKATGTGEVHARLDLGSPPACSGGASLFAGTPQRRGNPARACAQKRCRLVLRPSGC
jgi:hypothetical protein